MRIIITTAIIALVGGVIAIAASAASYAAENTTTSPPAAAERMATFVACMEARTAGTPAVAVTPFVKGVEFDARIVGARLDTRFAYRADTAKFARYNACRRAAGELAVAAN